MSAADDLRQSAIEVLGESPGLTARRRVNALASRGHNVDKGRVNSILYRNDQLFQNDGAVPPRWSLAQAAPAEATRIPHRVSGIVAENWKAFSHATAAFSAFGVQKSCDDEGNCGFYQFLQGTSMASPHATGVAALAVSAHGHKDADAKRGLTMAPDDVSALMAATATDHACPRVACRATPRKAAPRSTPPRAWGPRRSTASTARAS